VKEKVIDKFSDLSFTKDYAGKSAYVIYDNILLSIVCSEYSYGGKSGLYEIGVFSNDGRNIIVDGVTESEDFVRGWLSAKAVTHAIRRMSEITGVVGRQGGDLMFEWNTKEVLHQDSESYQKTVNFNNM